MSAGALLSAQWAACWQEWFLKKTLRDGGMWPKLYFFYSMEVGKEPFFCRASSRVLNSRQLGKYTINIYNILLIYNIQIFSGPFLAKISPLMCFLCDTLAGDC